MIRPTHNFVLIEPLANTNVSAGGIVIPDKVNATLLRGKVLATGPGLWNIEKGERMPVTVKPGDVVYYLPREVHRPSLLKSEVIVSEIYIVGCDEATIPARKREAVSV